MSVVNTIRLSLLLSSALLMLTSHAVAADSSEYSIYCNQAGGVVEKMPAIFYTSAGKATGLTKSFCTFGVDDGVIAIGLETFASSAPSIAATYMKNLGELSESSPLWKGNAANPSHNVCRNLGGSSIGFVAGGGFTNQWGESDICVFGDGSMVSGWSLIYMAAHRSGYDSIKNQVRAEPLSIELP